MTALIAYVNHLLMQQSSAYTSSVQHALGPIDQQIDHITRELSSEPKQGVTSGLSLALQQSLSTLLAQRAAASVTIAQNAAGGSPSLIPLASAGPGLQVAPKPTLYTGIAFLLALILASELIVKAAPRRPQAT
jgi:hypothetical protein